MDVSIPASIISIYIYMYKQQNEEERNKSRENYYYYKMAHIEHQTNRYFIKETYPTKCIHLANAWTRLKRTKNWLCVQCQMMKKNIHICPDIKMRQKTVQTLLHTAYIPCINVEYWKIEIQNIWLILPPHKSALFLKI